MDYQRVRLLYQFNKLEPIRKGVFPAHGGNVEFELYSFFEICYHLKDWVKHSPEHSSLGNVEEFINDSPAMRVCADICNRLKHKNLRKRRSNSEIGIFHLKSTMTIGPETGMARVSIEEATIETERGEECCYALAKECVEEWDRYFSGHGINLRRS